VRFGISRKEIPGVSGNSYDFGDTVSGLGVNGWDCGEREDTASQPEHEASNFSHNQIPAILINLSARIFRDMPLKVNCIVATQNAQKPAKIRLLRGRPCCVIQVCMLGWASFPGQPRATYKKSFFQVLTAAWNRSIEASNQPIDCLKAQSS